MISVLIAENSHRFKIDENGCWLWTGPICKTTGYGSISVNGAPWKTHRAFYSSMYGEIKNDLDHVCKIRICCNPNHLEDVTRKENIHRSKSTKLNLAVANEIRLRYKQNIKQKEIANEFNISFQRVNDVIHNRCWREV